MEKIDLMKCGNLRFKATVDRKEITGKIERSNQSFILTGDDGFGCVITLYELDNLLRGAKFVLKDGAFYVSDFEIVSRDPETYKDWQVGDRVICPDEKWKSIATLEVIFRSGELVAMKDLNGCFYSCYTCQELLTEGYQLVLTDIERQIIGDRKKYEPQDGDVVYAKVSHNDNDAIFIYKKAVENRIYGYAGYNIGFDKMVDTHGFAYITPNIIGDLIEYRPATEDEKQRLFDAMAKEGKRWNAEKKVVEDIPKPYEFKKGEPVLVRDHERNSWRIAAYSGEDPVSFLADTGKSVVHWKQCIPYNERTMHLLGTSEDYKEEQR